MPKWSVSRGGPQWLMDAEQRVIGYRDRRGAEWILFQESGAAGTAEMAGMPGAAVVTGLVKGDLASAAANTALAQAALLRGGRVEFTTPGIYYINSVLFTYSHTTVYVGPGVSIRMADGTSGGVFTNFAARLTLALNPTLVTSVTHGVSGAGVTWGAAPDGQNYCIIITGVPGIGAKYPVGSHVSVVATGHLTGQSQSNAGYRGVWKVLESTTNGIKYETRRVYPGSNNPIGALTIYPADENIHYTGPGTIDGNGPNISAITYVGGDPRGNVIWTRHARNVTVNGPNFKRGVTWTLGSNYVRDYFVVNCGGDVRGTSNNDFVHLSGAHQNAVLGRLAGAAGDNMVGMTIDITDDPGNVAHYPTYNFPFQDPGDMWGVTGADINSNTLDTAPFALIGLYGPPSYQYHGVGFGNLDGPCGACVSLANYAQTGMTQVTGDRLKLSGLRAQASGYQLDVVGAQSWNAITLDDVILFTENSPGAVNLSGTGTIGQFSLSNVQPMTATPRSFPVVLISTQNVTAISISDCEGVVMALGAAAGSGGIAALDGIGCPFTFHSGAGTIGKVNYRNVSVASSVAGAVAIHYAVGAGAVKSLVFDGCSFNGTTSSGAMFLQGPNAAYASVVFNSPVVAAAQGLFVGQNVNAAISVFINALTMGAGASACSYAGIFAGPTSLYLNGYAEVQAPTNNPFQCLTAGKLYNFRFENVGRDADSITKTAGTLRFHGLGARTAIANVDAPQTGDMVYNITGTVRVVRNIANNAWVSLHT